MLHKHAHIIFYYVENVFPQVFSAELIRHNYSRLLKPLLETILICILFNGALLAHCQVIRNQIIIH